MHIKECINNHGFSKLTEIPSTSVVKRVMSCMKLKTESICK